MNNQAQQNIEMQQCRIKRSRESLQNAMAHTRHARGNDLLVNTGLGCLIAMHLFLAINPERDDGQGNLQAWRLLHRSSL